MIRIRKIIKYTNIFANTPKELEIKANNVIKTFINEGLEADIEHITNSYNPSNVCLNNCTVIGYKTVL